jgi:hypothetical protein
MEKIWCEGWRKEMRCELVTYSLTPWACTDSTRSLARRDDPENLRRTERRQGIKAWWLLEEMLRVYMHARRKEAHRKQASQIETVKNESVKERYSR